MAKRRAGAPARPLITTPTLPRRPEALSGAPVLAGDIRFAILDGSRRLVLVLNAEDGHVCQVALATNEFDLATDQDVRVAKAEAHLPYDLLIEADVNGPLRPDRLGDRIGQLEGTLLAWITEAAFEGRFRLELDGRRGLPLHDLDGSRGAWKLAEGELLDRSLLAPAEADVPVFVDPAIFGSGTSASPDCLEVAMLEVAEGRARFGPRACLALYGYARDPNAVPWLRDAARAMTRTVTHSRIAGSVGDGWEGPKRRASGLPIEGLLADVLEAEAWHADILTARSAWARALPAGVLQYATRSATIHLIDCSEPARA